MDEQREPVRGVEDHAHSEVGTGEARDATRGFFTVARAVVARPSLWTAALIQGFRLARSGWWRKWPPLPVPSDGLWHLRMLTAYGGDGSSLPDPDDVTSYLEWCRTAREWRKR
jgi:hypothetical protein